MDKHSYYPFLDCIRFAAACLVVGVHYLPGSVSFGWVGAEIFFVISGVVISRSANIESAKEFARRRFLRLYPAVWICATMSFIVLISVGGDFNALLPTYLASLMLLPKIGEIDGVYWTLPVEISFYTSVFLLLYLRRVSWLPGLAWILSIASGLFLSIMLLIEVGILAGFNEHYVLMNILLLRHGCYFALGIWLLLISQSPTTIRIAGAALAAMFGVAQLVLRILRSHWSDTAHVWAPIIVWVAAVALIGASMRYARRGAPKSGVFAITRRLGLMTYPLYLIHSSVGLTIAFWLIDSKNTSRLVGLIFGVVLSLCLAWFVSSFGEPLIRRALWRSK